MSMMLRFISEAENVIAKLRQAEAEYSEGINAAERVVRSGRLEGTFMFAPTDGPMISLDVDAGTREDLINRFVAARVNANVDRMYQLWRSVGKLAEDAAVVIIAAQDKAAAAVTEAAVEHTTPTVVVPTQSVSQAVVQPVATSPAPAAATIPVVPSRVRRISREE